jgi:hypothetical protein
MLIKGFVTDIKGKVPIFDEMPVKAFMLGKMESSYWGYILKNMMGKVPHDVATGFNLVKPKPEAEVEVLVGDEVKGASEGVIGAGRGVLGAAKGVMGADKRKKEKKVHMVLSEEFYQDPFDFSRWRRIRKCTSQLESLFWPCQLPKTQSTFKRPSNLPSLLSLL